MLWALIAAGTGVRLILAFTTGGLPYDVGSFELVRHALAVAPLHVYSLVNPPGTFRWPYPPGFLPVVSLSSGLADLLGGFDHLIRLPAILADAALAWLVWWGCARRGSEREGLIAAGLVALGPVFVAIAGYATQIDSVAILPAVGALLVWEREGARHRAVAAGVLIGVAAAIKTVPLVMLLALLPSARSLREGATLVLAAAAVLVVVLAPFLLADPHGVLGIRRYTGAPGLGGLSLVLQPGLAQLWLIHPVALSGLESWLFVHHPSLLNAGLLLCAGGYLAVYRPPPRHAAAVLWLLVLAFGSGFFFQYLVWLLPFLLLAGRWRAAAALQLAVTPAMLLFYVTAWRSESIVPVYVGIMLAVWAAWVGGAALLAREGRLALGT